MPFDSAAQRKFLHMSEQLYCYKEVILSDGKRAFVREPFNPEDKFLNPPIVVPEHAPAIKNGEFPGRGSVVVDRLLAKTCAAEEAREARDNPPLPEPDTAVSGRRIKF
jgi:hypothetical protein